MQSIKISNLVYLHGTYFHTKIFGQYFITALIYIQLSPVNYQILQ